jgi:SAM-dependent MidA family methyltransferase
MKSSSVLPPATAQDIQQSALLVAKICASIQSSPNQCIGFDTFMTHCLYEPGLGYYSGPTQKFGAQGDFITAPMQSPLFGACIGQQCAQWLEQLGASDIIEFGAGDGLLAAQVLNELDRRGLRVQYAIVELSADLTARQRSTLATLAPQALERVVWLNALPTSFQGVVLGNELIDAMPVRLFGFEKDASGLLKQVERCVTVNNDSANPLFAWCDRPVDALLGDEIRAALENAEWGHERAPGFTSELALQAKAWLASVASFLHRGVILLLDYGFSAREFYHPQRSEGTLNCHYRHHSHAEPFYLPGLQDITAHVDFSSLFHAAQAQGLDLVGYTNQANFLMNLQILDKLEVMTPSTQYPLHAQAVGRLLSEAEMGDLFKAIAFAKLEPDVAFESSGFATADKSHTL